MKIDINQIINKIKSNKVIKDLFSEETTQKKYIIFDIGNYNLKALFCEITDKIYIKDCRILKLDFEKYGNYSEALENSIKDILYGKKIEDTKLGVLLSGQYVINRFIVLPKIPEDELKQALKFEIKKNLHLNIAEVSFNYSINEVLKDENGKEKLKVFVGIIKKNDIENIENIFSDFGVPLAFITIDSLLYQKGYEFQQEEESVAYIEIGAENTNFNIIKNNNLEFSRNIPMGGVALSELIAKDISGSPTNFREFLNEAEIEKRKTPLYLEEDELEKMDQKKKIIAMSLMDGVGRILQRIRLTVGYYKTQVKGKNIKKIYLLGGVSSIKNIEKYFQKHLDVETHKIEFNPADFVDFNENIVKNRLKENIQFFWLSLLIAEKLFLEGDVINFYQKDKSEKITFDTIVNYFPEPKNVFITASLFIFIYYMLVGIPQYWNMKKLYTKYEKVSEKIIDIRDLENEIKYSLTINKKNNQNVFNWLQEFKEADKNWVKLLTRISENIPDNAYVDVLEINTNRQVHPVRYQLKIDFEFMGEENIRQVRNFLENPKTWENISFNKHSLDFHDRPGFSRGEINYHRLIMEGVFY
ncbi:MAG: pilus assembly protein PilM [Candidatus Muiribacteriota bacterium]